jgi:hypothetical protein
MSLLVELGDETGLIFAVDVLDSVRHLFFELA